jgi:hypothetical protein
MRFHDCIAEPYVRFGSGMAQHEPVARIKMLYRNGWPGSATSGHWHRRVIAPAVDAQGVTSKKARPRLQLQMSEDAASKNVYLSPSIAYMAIAGLFHLLEDPTQVVGFRSLQRREFLIGQKVLPQLLADGQHVPVVEKGG